MLGVLVTIMCMLTSSYHPNIQWHMLFKFSKEKHQLGSRRKQKNFPEVVSGEGVTMFQLWVPMKLQSGDT